MVCTKPLRNQIFTMGISHVWRVNLLKYSKGVSTEKHYPSDKCLCIFYEGSSTAVQCIQEYF